MGPVQISTESELRGTSKELQEHTDDGTVREKTGISHAHEEGLAATWRS